jgi:hypothetical protein
MARLERYCRLTIKPLAYRLGGLSQHRNLSSEFQIYTQFAK